MDTREVALLPENVIHTDRQEPGLAHLLPSPIADLDPCAPVTEEETKMESKRLSQPVLKEGKGLESTQHSGHTCLLSMYCVSSYFKHRRGEGEENRRDSCSLRSNTGSSQ